MTAAERTDPGQRGLLDTSFFIADEAGRPHGELPQEAAVSVITLAELHLGVLMADDPVTRATRLRTLSSVEEVFDPLPVTVDVTRIFAELAAEARREGRRPKIMDTWIAATALSHDLPVYTQDSDFDSIPKVLVVRM